MVNINCPNTYLRVYFVNALMLKIARSLKKNGYSLIFFFFEKGQSYFHLKLENKIDMSLIVTKQNSQMTKNRRTYLLISKIILAFVLFGAATLILILFERTANMNMFLIYTAAGLILGLGVVQLINLFDKND